MKVVCDACGTKYSIDDGRVAGRAVKIRCKQCAHVIVLRGRALTAEPVPDAGTWFAVIDGTSRPIEVTELHRLRAAGQLGDRSLVWREGFEDWCELGTVDELRAPRVPSVEVAAGAGTASPPPEPVLRHQRNQSSALFSLRELAKIADPPRAGASPVTSIEGSGLLDIRSIARGLAPSRTERSSPDVPLFGPVGFGEPAVLVPRPARRDRRLVWALAASIGALAIVTTVLLLVVMRDRAPVRADPSPSPPPGTPVAAPARPGPLAAAPVPAARSVATVAPLAPTAPPAARQAASVPPPAARLAAAPTTDTAAAPATPATPAVAAPPAVFATGESPAHPTAAASRRAATRASSTPPIAPARSSETAPPQLQPPRADDACSEVTCLVNGYADDCCRIYRQAAGSPAAPPAPDRSLPENLDRDAVAAGLAGIDTSGCRGRSAVHGDVAVSVKVSPAGAVTAVAVKSSPDPELGACVTVAARQGRFARTQRGGSFAYMWRF